MVLSFQEALPLLEWILERLRFVQSIFQTQKTTILKKCIIPYNWCLLLLPVLHIDGDPNGVVYKDYTQNTFVPNFSHHKLTCFEYADGKNPIDIDDGIITYSTTRTDLDMYYEKVGLVYGPSSGREIEPDYPAAGLDIQPKIEEFRIVDLPVEMLELPY